eukprot:2134975-Amphidinium_carterae.1
MIASTSGVRRGCPLPELVRSRSQSVHSQAGTWLEGGPTCTFALKLTREPTDHTIFCNSPERV